MIEREEILTLIPHSGRMCLLDRVLRWDSAEALCATNSHRDPNNPLRRDNRLAALHLIEYGAQTMAIHGGLLARDKGGARPGMLVSVRDFTTQLQRIDDLPGELQILARKQIAGSTALSYEFSALHAGQLLASGRVSVILGEARHPIAVIRNQQTDQRSDDEQ